VLKTLLAKKHTKKNLHQHFHVTRRFKTWDDKNCTAISQDVHSTTYRYAH